MGDAQYTSNIQNQEKREQEEQQRQNLLEARRVTLRAILTIEAQERLNRISSVKPEKAAMIENYLLQRFSYSNIKVDDAQLKHIIEGITKSQTKNTSIRIQRKRWDDEDDDDDDF
ncbi:double-stranded DNA-binding domain containing protein [Theileria equi strain WA]|uniref:Double-stranded DNA-binding domain containing protein n=1 Tax=Theileria equi strain WA TaxID=1537102 RepID=L1L9X7_THEEQ|nr:double-stranded DNA-binding domain containing protein [Theileria equi strain WA]EKX71985.1 double-stranded DNA-binding domain containing protein [Theileria equi strain WA]|eukprot:XP_004831437.1 double-stranded DNA-binding domain containing protein [Theileria equi strain WA]